MANPSTPRAADVLGRVTLVTGKEEFLNERTVTAVREAVRAHDPDAEMAETTASDLSLATLGEMAAASLFSAVRCVVVRGLENLPEESVDGLVAYATDPVEDVALVLVHGGGPKGSGTLGKLRKLPAVVESKSGELKLSELPSFIISEVRGHGSTIDAEAASFLVQAVGQDLRSLSAAAHQLANDFPGEPLGIDKIRQYFGGRAEAKSFAVADAAFWGRRTVALEELRWALDGGTPAVLVTSAFAGGARGVARYKSAPRGMREADLAREVGVPPWKLRTIRDQSRGWSDAGIARAIRAVARADADIKGAASDASYTLERLVLTVTALRDSR
jgi:DNA polymerase-3 subunit delta